MPSFRHLQKIEVVSGNVDWPECSPVPSIVVIVASTETKHVQVAVVCQKEVIVTTAKNT